MIKQQFLRPLLHGTFTFVLLALNTLIFASLLLIIIPFKILAPNEKLKRCSYKAMEWFAQTWVDGNTLIFRLTQKTQWEVKWPSTALQLDGWYLIISNHRSWADILVLLAVFNRKIPFLKFFIKRELLRFPLLGLIWWALDYPIMKRYSKEYLRRHPQKKGRDLETTRRACEKFKDTPVSILNFLEGTRFTHAKHAVQKSPYRHLLVPKAGGIAFALSAMGERFCEILNVTIVYPISNFRFWHMLNGKLPRLAVRIETISIPADALAKDYQTDSEFQIRFREWVNQLWQQKDQLINDILIGYGQST
ncbi:MAG: acyltransferase [Desulforhabdus sp.]|jgi:1-acyl-sn-glycerol-3-phosphate acyltransferase|nr:acyltransferase [Desulforhabdus sp.]